MSFFKMIVSPGDGTEDPLMFHGGEECGFMLVGSLQLEIEGEVYFIDEGDSIYFDSSLPHRFTNDGDVDAVAVWTMTHSF